MKYGMPKAIFLQPAVIDTGESILGTSNTINSTKIRQYSKSLTDMSIGTKPG